MLDDIEEILEEYHGKEEDTKACILLALNEVENIKAVMIIGLSYKDEQIIYTNMPIERRIVELNYTLSQTNDDLRIRRGDIEYTEEREE
jgi:hypothetical protein